MKLKIKQDRIGPGMARGIDESGIEHFVLGGDLCYGEIIEAVPSKESSKILVNHKVNYDNVEIFSKYFDEEGLIEFQKLKEVKHKSKPHSRIYELDGYWVFVEMRIKNQVEYLYQNALIESSKIRITRSWATMTGRAPVYSVNYLNLLKKVIAKREAVSSWFICEKEKDFDKGVYADLYILGNFNENDLQIQLWQIIGQGDEVLFAHGLIDKNTFKFNHFDLASHYIDPIMIPRLIYAKQRMDLMKKTKWMRVDGEISEEQIFEMIKMFFPLDYLVDEFREIPLGDGLFREG